MSTPVSEPPKGRLRQFRQAYAITKKSDKRIGLILLAWFVGVGAIFATTGYFLFGKGTLSIVLAVVFGLLTGLLAVLIVFGRRAERSAYAQVEGQIGAAAGALQMLKKGFSVKPAVAFTKNQDVVHRVLGRQGIILVGEGNPNRVRNLLATEVKKHSRIAGDVPITVMVIGNGPDEVKLTKLIKKVRKLPKKIKGADMTSTISKLRALDAMRPAAPMPHGPMPTSMKGSRKAMRG